MIKLKDIIFEVKIVGPCEGYPNGKSGREMVALYQLPDGKGECIYAQHDFSTEKLTDAFKKRALKGIQKKVKTYDKTKLAKLKL